MRGKSPDRREITGSLFQSTEGLIRLVAVAPAFFQTGPPASVKRLAEKDSSPTGIYFPIDFAPGHNRNRDKADGLNSTDTPFCYRTSVSRFSDWPSRDTIFAR